MGGLRNLFLGLLVLPLSSGAALRTTAVVRDYSSGQEVAHSAAMVFERDALQIDTTSFTGGRARTDLIYRAADQRLWHVDHGGQSYLEVDERIAVTVADGVTRAIETVGGWLKGEQAAAGTPVAKTRRTGETRVLGGMTCERVEMLEGSKVVQDVWLASWSEAELTSESMVALRQLATSSDRIVSTLTSMGVLQGFPALPLAAVAALDGYPVMIRQYEDGKTVLEVSLGKPRPVGPHPKRYQVDPAYARRLL